MSAASTLQFPCMIIELAKKYLSFQQEIGSKQPILLQETIEKLFCETFKKIANDIPVVSHRHHLKEQLENVRQVSGPWQLREREIIPFQDPYRCLIRYQLISEKLGTYEVMAILHRDQQNKIQSIDEMYHQVMNLNRQAS